MKIPRLSNLFKAVYAIDLAWKKTALLIAVVCGILLMVQFLYSRMFEI